MAARNGPTAKPFADLAKPACTVRRQKSVRSLRKSLTPWRRPKSICSYISRITPSLGKWEKECLKNGQAAASFHFNQTRNISARPKSDRSSPAHVIAEGLQDLVFEFVLHQNIKIISREFPRGRVVTRRPRIERVCRCIVHVAGLR